MFRSCFRVLLRICLDLFDAFVAANSNFLATDFHLDAAVVDRPITYWTLLCIHDFFSPQLLFFFLTTRDGQRSRLESVIETPTG